MCVQGGELSVDDYEVGKQLEEVKEALRTGFVTGADLARGARQTSRSLVLSTTTTRSALDLLETMRRKTEVCTPLPITRQTLR